MIYDVLVVLGISIGYFALCGLLLTVLRSLPGWARNDE